MAMKRLGVSARVLAVLFGVMVSCAYGEALAEVRAEQFVLTGVVVLDGERGVAWLQEPTLTGDRVVTLRVGQSIGRYTLEKVFEDRVELKGPAGRVMVSLYNPNAPGPAVTSAEGGNSPPSQVAAAHPAKSPELQGQAEQALSKFVLDRKAAMKASGSASSAPSPEDAKARTATWQRLLRRGL
jgi:hypothetical protein